MEECDQTAATEDTGELIKKLKQNFPSKKIPAVITPDKNATNNLTEKQNSNEASDDDDQPIADDAPENTENNEVQTPDHDTMEEIPTSDNTDPNSPVDC